MEAKLIDTNIFIDIFRGNETYHRKLSDINGHINDVIYIELIQGGRLNKSELREIKKYIRPFRRLHISQQISITAVTLVEQYGAGSHYSPTPIVILSATPMVLFHRGVVEGSPRSGHVLLAGKAQADACARWGGAFPTGCSRRISAFWHLCYFLIFSKKTVTFPAPVHLIQTDGNARILTVY